MNFLERLLPYGYSLVYYIIWLGGIVYAIINRRKHPHTSLFAGIALSVLLFTGLLSIIVSIYAQYQFSAGELSASELAKMSNALSVCAFPFSILGQLLLLVAIFWRKDGDQNQTVNNHAG